MLGKSGRPSPLDGRGARTTSDDLVGSVGTRVRRRPRRRTRPDGRPLPPEDRLWRHPSEVGASRRAGLAAASRARPAAGPPDARASRWSPASPGRRRRGRAGRSPGTVAAGRRAPVGRELDPARVGHDVPSPGGRARSPPARPPPSCSRRGRRGVEAGRLRGGPPRRRRAPHPATLVRGLQQAKVVLADGRQFDGDGRGDRPRRRARRASASTPTGSRRSSELGTRRRSRATRP